MKSFKHLATNAFLLLLLSCGQTETDGYKINGRITNPRYDKKTVYMVDATGQKCDSAAIKDCKFTFTGKHDTTKVMELVLHENDSDLFPIILPVVLEKGDGNTYSVASGVSVEDASDGVISWTAPSGEAPSENGHDTYKSVTLTGLTAETTYKIVAYGYNVQTAGGAASFTATATSSNAAVFEVGSSSAAFTPEEIFAGTSDEFTTDAEGNATTSVQVTMDRQIAGLLAYLTGIPTKLVGANGALETVEQVVVYANAKSSGITFPSTTDFNGKDCSTAKTALLTFDMSAIATNYVADATAQTEAKYTFNTINDNTVTATGTANQDAKPYASEYTGTIVPSDLTLKENSIFGACFVLPYDAHKDSQTLTIELQNGTGTALKTLNVTTTDAPSDVTGGSVVGTKAYDIRRNNFYSIGKKLATDNTDGDEEDDDEEPNPDNEDEDNPIDVSEENEIVLLINDSWDVLHNMGIE